MTRCDRFGVLWWSSAALAHEIDGRRVMRNQLIFSTLVLGLLLTLPISAEDGPIARVPVEEHPADSEARTLLDAIRAGGNRPINLNLVSALSPKLARARSAVVSTIRYESVVPRALRELTILRTAQLMGGDYEVHQHMPAALNCGYSQAQLDSLAHWQDSTLFSERERALLAYLDQAVRSKAEVNDKTFGEFARLFNTKEIVEVTMIAAQYMGTSMLTNALRVKIDEPGVLAAIVLGPC
jgi:alkylhydroperoxidase family enzyme